MRVTVICRLVNQEEQDLVADKAHVYKKKLNIELNDVKYFHEGFEKNTLHVYIDTDVFVIEEKYENFYQALQISLDEEWNDNNGIWVSFSKN